MFNVKVRRHEPTDLIRVILDGEYNISCARPLEDVSRLESVLERYKPRKEEKELYRSFALDRVKMWKRDLILGQCKQ